mmetsp:Transcript_4912/g.10669  ORF Transcript_4912/g.10669 Transcript_4912/m.10669 type:complete len:201 (+) Transcript_4912:153-755(+)
MHSGRQCRRYAEWRAILTFRRACLPRRRTRTQPLRTRATISATAQRPCIRGSPSSTTRPSRRVCAPRRRRSTSSSAPPSAPSASTPHAPASCQPAHILLTIPILHTLLTIYTLHTMHTIHVIPTLHTLHTLNAFRKTPRIRLTTLTLRPLIHHFGTRTKCSASWASSCSRSSSRMPTKSRKQQTPAISSSSSAETCSPTM